MHWIFYKRTVLYFWKFHRPEWCIYWTQVYWGLNFTSECLRISRVIDNFTNCIKDVNRSEFFYLLNKSYILNPFIKTFHSLSSWALIGCIGLLVFIGILVWVGESLWSGGCDFICMEKEFLNISLNKVKSKPGFSNIPNNLHVILSSVA